MAPWTREKCGREGCKPCEFRPGDCKKLNVTYELECQNCKEAGVKKVYIGESSRTFWDRAKEHAEALTKKDPTYAVVKHWEISHPELEEPPEYSYKILKKHHSAIHRQIWEAISIQSIHDDQLLNS